MDPYALVREAIRKKQIIIATYGGHAREMCPHALGLSTRTGRTMALLYQFGGTSERSLGPDGSARNWRCLPVDDLSHVSTRDGKWHTGQRPKGRQTCIDVVDAEVPPEP
jgi:hypothetical protein